MRRRGCSNWQRDCGHARGGNKKLDVLVIGGCAAIALILRIRFPAAYDLDAILVYV